MNVIWQEGMSYKSSNACDGCGMVRGQVRRLPTGGDSAVIICRQCYRKEMNWRRERNRDLEKSCQFDLPEWKSLEVYTGV